MSVPPLFKEIVVRIGCEIGLSAGLTTERLTVTDLLEIVQTAGDALVTRAIESVEGNAGTTVDTGINLGTAHDRIAVRIHNAGSSCSVHIKLDYLQVTSGVGVRSVASLGLNIAGESFEAAATGNGPVDAAISALKQIIKRNMTLKEFTIQAISKGSDDVGKVHMQVEYNNQLYYGFGANTDIIAASVEAYIDCINKFK